MKTEIRQGDLIYIKSLINNSSGWYYIYENMALNGKNNDFYKMIFYKKGFFYNDNNEKIATVTKYIRNGWLNKIGIEVEK